MKAGTSKLIQKKDMKKEENMESEKNKDIARRFIQVWGRGNLEIIDKLASSELSVYYPAFPHALKGTAAFKERLEKLRVGFGDADIEIDEEIAEGDKVVLRWTYSATHQAEYPPGVPPTGKRMTWTGITIYRIVDGKIVEERGEENYLGVLRQLDLIPEPPA